MLSVYNTVTWSWSTVRFGSCRRPATWTGWRLSGGKVGETRWCSPWDQGLGLEVRRGQRSVLESSWRLSGGKVIETQWCSPRDQGLGLEVPRGQRSVCWRLSGGKVIETQWCSPRDQGLGLEVPREVSWSLVEGWVVGRSKWMRQVGQFGSHQSYVRQCVHQLGSRVPQSSNTMSHSATDVDFSCLRGRFDAASRYLSHPSLASSHAV